MQKTGRKDDNIKTVSDSRAIFNLGERAIYINNTRNNCKAGRTTY